MPVEALSLLFYSYPHLLYGDMAPGCRRQVMCSAATCF